jgi:muconolactone delta-isomerase
MTRLPLQIGSVGKLAVPKINLIMQHKTKNIDLLADNIHNIRTEQIWTNSTRLTYKIGIDNGSNHKTVIAINWNCRFTHIDFHEFCRGTRADVREALSRNLICWHPCRSSKRRQWFGDTTLPWFAARQTKGRQGREATTQRELRRRGWVGCYWPLSSDWRTYALYRRAAATPWFDLLNSRNRPPEYLYVQPPVNLARNVRAHYSWLTWQFRCDIW